MVKRTYALVMFTVLLLNSAGFYVYYIAQLQRNHTEMQAKLRYLPDHQLEVLVLSNEAYLKSRVDEHEVKVKGKMYDVARVEAKGDSVHIFCLHDEKEDNLLSLFAELIGKPLESSSSMPVAIIKFIGLHFVVFEDAIPLAIAHGEVPEWPGYCLTTCQTIFDIPTPPPRDLVLS